jgi:hypothetical protein
MLLASDLSALSQSGTDGQTAATTTVRTHEAGRHQPARPHGRYVSAGHPKVPVGRLLDARCQRAAARGVQPRSSGTTPHREPSIEVSANDDANASSGGPPRVLGQLQADRVEGHGVIGGDGAFVLLTEDLVQIDVAQRHEGCGRSAGG